MRWSKDIRGSMAVDIILFSVLIIVIIGMGFICAAESELAKGVLLPGSMINGVDISGQTVDQASATLTETIVNDIENFAVDVQIGQSIYEMTAEDVGITSNAQDVLESSLNKVHNGNVFSRLQMLYAVQNGLELDHRMHYDASAVQNYVHELAQRENIAPQNARASYNNDLRVFEYAPAADGAYIDESSLHDMLTATLDNTSNEKIEIQLLPLKASVTEDDLRANMQLTSSYATMVENDANIRHNIDLFIELLNGQTIGIGEEFSLNRIIGDISREAGYKEAQVMYSGLAVSELGGGIGQVASTLYNAALLAGMDIVERNNNEIPVNFVPIGQDAMIDMISGKDLILRNASSYPLLVSIVREEDNLECKMFGAFPDDIDAITVDSVIKRTIPAGSPNVYYDNTMQKGEEIQEALARDGYQVETYRYYYHRNVLMKEETVSQDYYKPSEAVIRKGSK